MHTLSAIRQALASLLVNQTGAGASVWSGQAKRFGDAPLPALHIRLSGRDTQAASDIPAQSHQVNLAIAIVCQADGDDQAEALLEQVETILTRNPTLNGLLNQPLQATQLLVSVDTVATPDLLIYTQAYTGRWQEEPFAALTVTEAATTPAFGQFKQLHVDLDAPPFDSAAEHARWLAGDYSRSRPEAQSDHFYPGASS
ncbi:hypothetical protein [Jeongeupia naejangsanensis]|uniref:Uncharacterized protein n=1 Tax=Jeongeupia naejangsanensis TaxID=613195 RepID=A0ABS2BH90_9NEIS|nr:hypothetical protein [Jeongeupia naejangsanensis]MBM3114990.1 hypothetical protein [Jeongeupia naejangsanensis]